MHPTYFLLECLLQLCKIKPSGLYYFSTPWLATKIFNQGLTMSPPPDIHSTTSPKSPMSASSSSPGISVNSDIGSQIKQSPGFGLKPIHEYTVNETTIAVNFFNLFNWNNTFQFSSNTKWMVFSCLALSVTMLEIRF